MYATARQHLLAVFRAGIAAVDPEAAVLRHVARAGDVLRIGPREIDLAAVRSIFVVGAGKASAFMARALESVLGDRITAGLVNVKTGHGCALRKVRVREAAHPIPDAAGVEGSRGIEKLLEGAAEGDLVICCLSGGGSALLPLPVESVGLEEKRRITADLLACGAPIQEVNAVRKHLSRIKGGQLARMARPAQLVTLILSDVIGDPLDVIASGPTAPDESTFQQALDIITKYGLDARLSEGAAAHLRAGAAGRAPETPKPGDPLFDGVSNIVVANNAAAVEAAAEKARRLGYAPYLLSTAVEGEAREVAAAQAGMARGVRENGAPIAPPACIISGGETTVTVRGDGKGGRNQEFALAGSLALRGCAGGTLLGAGTDGTDGPTDAAGAFADGETCARAEAAGLDANDFLRRNDSYNFFRRLDDLLITGPTGTNVMDLYLFLISAA